MLYNVQTTAQGQHDRHDVVSGCSADGLRDRPHPRTEHDQGGGTHPADEASVRPAVHFVSSGITLYRPARNKEPPKKLRRKFRVYKKLWSGYYTEVSVEHTLCQYETYPCRASISGFLRGSRCCCTSMTAVAMLTEYQILLISIVRLGGCCIRMLLYFFFVLFFSAFCV